MLTKDWSKRGIEPPASTNGLTPQDTKEAVRHRLRGRLTSHVMQTMQKRAHQIKESRLQKRERFRSYWGE